MAHVPVEPVFAAFAAVALATGRHEIVRYGVAAFVSRFDVIKRVGRSTAVGAAVIPGVEDPFTELLLGAALGYEVGAVNRMIHAVRG